MAIISIIIIAIESVCVLLILAIAFNRQWTRNRHDVFLSYRRNGGSETAGRIYEALKRRYRVFMDVEALRKPGLFDTTLLSKIESAKDFLIVLTPGSLERCVNEDDWVRREVAYAIKISESKGHNLTVIPILDGNFHWPESLPEDISALQRYNGLEPSHKEFSHSMKMLEKMLKSRPKLPVATILFIFLSVFLIADSIWRIGVVGIMVGKRELDKTILRVYSPFSSRNTIKLDQNNNTIAQKKYKLETIPWSSLIGAANLQASRWTAKPSLRNVIAGTWTVHGRSTDKSPCVLNVSEWRFLYVSENKSIAEVRVGILKGKRFVSIDNKPNYSFALKLPELKNPKQFISPVAAINAAFDNGAVLRNGGLFQLRNLSTINKSFRPIWVVPAGLEVNDFQSVHVDALSGDIVSPHTLKIP